MKGRKESISNYKCQKHTSKSNLLLLSQRLGAVQKVTTRALGTRNVGQTTSVENANGVGRPGSREVKTRTHLGEELLLIRSLQEGLLSKSSHIVALAQKPGEDLHCYAKSGGFYSELLLGELGGDLDVVAELSINLLNLLRNVLSGLSQETVRSSLGKSRSAKVVDNNFSTGSNHVQTRLLHDCSKGTGIEPKRKQFYQIWWNEESPRDWRNNRDYIFNPENPPIVVKFDNLA